MMLSRLAAVLLKKRGQVEGVAHSSGSYCRYLSSVAQEVKDPNAGVKPYHHKVSPEVQSSSAQRAAAIGFTLAGLGAVYWGTSTARNEVEPTTLTNWSGTHEVTTKAFFQPESEAELEHIVSACHKTGQRLRVVGSALSPNGIAFDEGGMLSMGLLDKVISVDAQKMQVRVQCGTRVQEVVEALRPYGLTLQNFASIREQQIGGFTQVSAHGTGASIPPVDEQVVRMRLITPAKGPMELSRDDKNPSLFKLARAGLGCFGVVSEVTLQCVPSHKLLEKTFVSTRQEVKKYHTRWLKENKHLRYMWIPYTDCVVVVQCNPVEEGKKVPEVGSPKSAEDALSTTKSLLAERAVDGMIGEYTLDQANDLKFTQMRDVLLALDPLNVEWVKKVNSAEADFWKHSEGYQMGWSDEILGFDCGGQQWVLEVAMPAGTYAKPSHADLRYIDDLMREIEASGIAAHSPIEQRWTAGSSSTLSPVSSQSPNDLHSWIGIIMYLPTEDPKEREKITQSFMRYMRISERKLMPKYHALWHWAKLELPEDPAELADIQKRMAERFPIEKIREARQQLDPSNIMGNQIVDSVFG